MTSRCGLAFSFTVRMIDRIHDDAANGWPDTTPTLSTSFADGPQVMLLVSDLAYCGAAVHMYFPDLTGTQAQLGVVTFPRE